MTLGNMRAVNGHPSPDKQMGHAIGVTHCWLSQN
jgi:hypothetical protein